MTSQPTKAIRLIAVRADGRQVEHRLDMECGVLVGSSETCGLSLQGEGLARFHCMVSNEEDGVWVQDWASESGTHINGAAIEGRTKLSPESRLKIGNYVITVAVDPLPRTSAPRPAQAVHPESVAEPAEPETDDLEVDALEADEPDTEPLFDSFDFSTEGLPPCPDASPLVLDDSMFTAEMYDRETVELLRAEIETLQHALAQRDAELAAALEGQFGDDAPDDGIRDDASADIMLQRIDQLLDEAASRDHREALLQELLHAAEDANEAEREERRQLENWVGDLENRISQRDQQRTAEFEHLRQCLREAEAERDQAATRLQSLVSGGATPSQLETSLARLEQDNQQLRGRLKAMAAELERARAESQQADDAREQAMRHERIQLAQERAVISRMRSDLAARLADAEHQAALPQHSGQEADVRTRALREHLREIHAQEQLGASQAPTDTLASRVSRLWKRL